MGARRSAGGSYIRVSRAQKTCLSSPIRPAIGSVERTGTSAARNPGIRTVIKANKLPRRWNPWLPSHLIFEELAMLKHKGFLVVLALAVGAEKSPGAAGQANQPSPDTAGRPNIVFMMADNLGY